MNKKYTKYILKVCKSKDRMNSQKRLPTSSQQAANKQPTSVTRSLSVWTIPFPLGKVAELTAPRVLEAERRAEPTPGRRNTACATLWAGFRQNPVQLNNPGVSTGYLTSRTIYLDQRCHTYVHVNIHEGIY
jgi:hypothetical protein